MSTATLHFGDCLQVMASIPDESVNAVICDPPYGTTQCSWDSVIDMNLMWAQLKRITKPCSPIVLMSAQPFTSLLIGSNLEMFRYEWIWEKGAATGFLNAKKQPLRAHENVVVFYRQQPTFNPQMTSGHQRKTSAKKSVNSECYGKALKLTEYDSTDRYPRSVQFFSSDKQSSNLHPTQKPVALMRYLVETYTRRGDTVLDFTMGSGTTGIACRDSGRAFIGIEKQEKYFLAAKQRISEPFTPDLLEAIA